VGGYQVVGGNSFVSRHKFWSHIAMPKIGGRFWALRVYPPEWQRDHYGERLGVSMDGCYDRIEKEQILPRLKEFIAMDKWLPVERLMLESMLNKAAPAWAQELRKANEERRAAQDKAREAKLKEAATA
jgi:hypothetical protein